MGVSPVDNDVMILGNLVITSLLKAQAAMADVMKQPKTTYIRDAAIQRFEFSYELGWKTMKRILDYRGISVNSPRETFREAAKEGLIKNVKQWFEFLDYRNETVHTYDEAIAEEIYKALPEFLSAMNAFVEKIRTL